MPCEYVSMEIPNELVNEISAYLGKRPYAEVQKICLPLDILIAKENERLLQKQKSPDTKKTGDE